MVKSNFKNIGILGGSFDPPHSGHLYISEKSLKVFKLEKIIWAITYRNPLKKKPFLIISNLVGYIPNLLSFFFQFKVINSIQGYPRFNFIRNFVNRRYINTIV